MALSLGAGVGQRGAEQESLHCLDLPLLVLVSEALGVMLAPGQ